MFNIFVCLFLCSVVYLVSSKEVVLFYSDIEILQFFFFIHFFVLFCFFVNSLTHTNLKSNR